MKNLIAAIPAERYSRLLDRIGLSQRGAARFFGINERTSRAYASGESPVDPRTAMLLEIMARYKIAPEDALRLIGISPREAAKATREEMGPYAEPRYFNNHDRRRKTK